MPAQGPRSLIEQFIGFEGKTSLRASCKTAQAAIQRQRGAEQNQTQTPIQKQTEKEIAQEKIRRMVGELKWVEPGSFLMGSEEGEPDFIYEGKGLNQKPHFVEIKEGYWLPVDDITVANYHYVMTGQWITKENQKVKEELKKEQKGRKSFWKRLWNTSEEKKEKQKGGTSKYPDLAFLIENEKKPMRSLTEAQWDLFTQKLNGKMAKEWPTGYPDLYKAHGNKPPVFDRPEDKELEFATTIPLKEEMEVDNPGYQSGSSMDEKAPSKVKITAKHSLFSGTDRKVKFDKNGWIPKFDKEGKEKEDYKEISKYVVCQRDWSDGPSDVDSVLPNERGFRNLSGNIWKQTKTPFRARGSYRQTPRGGGRVLGQRAEVARAASRPTGTPSTRMGMWVFALVPVPVSFASFNLCPFVCFRSCLFLNQS